MLIEIEAVEPSMADAIRFRCQAGVGTAGWGAGSVPTPGTLCHVELDHDRPLRWTSQGILTDDSTGSCHLLATARVDDSGTWLELGDGLMMVDLDEDQLPLADRTVWLLQDVALTVFPTDH